MTLEQLRIFIEVAERAHLTQSAQALNLTPSALSASIRALEHRYGVRLFNRVGRGIEVTQAGAAFLPEAKATLARACAAQLALVELAGGKRGQVRLQASQTIASYWLPPLLVQFRAAYPDLEIELTVGNTQSVTQAVIDGDADLGFVEGAVAEKSLLVRKVDEDRLILIVRSGHPWADGRTLTAKMLENSCWVMREPGSGTRSAFESALRQIGGDLTCLRIGLTLPSNEAVRGAIETSQMTAVISERVAGPSIVAGKLAHARLELPTRAFILLRHKERYTSQACEALSNMAGECESGAAT